MASGNTTTGSLADSLQTIINSARVTEMVEGVMSKLVENQKLGEGIGLSWNEISLANLTAQSISETTELNNPQEITDTIFSITPTVIGIHTVITDRTKARIAASVFAKIGDLGMKACLKKADQDGITAIDGATTSLCGAGNTLATGYITAAAERIKGNSTEPYTGGTINAVFHSYGIKDIKDELIGSVGTYPVVDGLTASVFTNGALQGRIGGVSIFEDNNITVDSSDDAKGGVFAKEALVLVTGRSPRAVHVRNEKLGGGADEYLLYFEYAYGERSAGNWLFEIAHDCTAPSS
jgi:hypothetical protein